MRGDAATVRAHLDAIAPDLPEVAAAYRALSWAVLLAVRPALDPEAAATLAELLAEPSAGPSGADA